MNLPYEEIKPILVKIEKANQNYKKTYKGVLETRQPVHTVYGGAHLFRAKVAEKLGKTSKDIFLKYAPDPITFAKKIQLKGFESLNKNQTSSEKNYSPLWFANTVWNRVLKKIEKEAIEDFRIDFEDGFGVRSDEEEDAVCISAGEELAKGLSENSLPPFIGIRIKSFDFFAKRSIRTLDIFLSTLLKKTSLPTNFVITFPKVSLVEHIEALVEVLEKLESIHGLKPLSLKLELMVELTQTILNQKGSTQIWNLIEATKGRCRGLHFGTYDYTASCDIIAQFQAMDNPVCDFAKNIMQVTAMGTRIMLSDGATNIFPVPIHDSPQNPIEHEENSQAIYKSWKLQFNNIQHSLRSGFYQGWDLHPAQLPIRYAACYAFYLSDLEEMNTRMINFLDTSGKATLSADVFDDAATGQGLINYYLKGYNCGAIVEKDLVELGITPATLQTRSFPKIIEEYKKNKL